LLGTSKMVFQKVFSGFNFSGKATKNKTD